MFSGRRETLTETRIHRDLDIFAQPSPGPPSSPWILLIGWTVIWTALLSCGFYILHHQSAADLITENRQLRAENQQAVEDGKNLTKIILHNNNVFEKAHTKLQGCIEQFNKQTEDIQK